MPQNIELPSRSISFRTDLQVMVVRWHSHASFEVVQADYAHMLAAAEERGISDWLLDVRRRNKIPADLSAWVTNVFYPQATQRLAPAACAWPCSTRRPSPKRIRRTPTRKNT